MLSQLSILRFLSVCLIQMNLIESDDSNLGSEEEYIPQPMDESTESDSSMEITLEKENKNKGASSSKSKFKPRDSGSESSSQKRSPGTVEVNPPVRKDASPPVRASLTPGIVEVNPPVRVNLILARAELMGMKRL